MKNVVSRKAIRRLRLRKGDAIIVSDFGMVKSAQDVGQAMDLGFDVPIFVVPEGMTFKRVCKEYILKTAKKIVEDFETVSKPKEESNGKA